MASASRRWTWREYLARALGASSARSARVAGIGLALLALLLPRAARAELNLRWSAPSGCPTKEDVLRRMRSLGVTLSRVSADLSVSGSIIDDGSGFLLSVWVREGDGERRRTIRNESCSDLANAAAVTLALLLDVELAAPAGALPGRDDGGGGSDAGRISHPEGSAPPAGHAKAAEPPRPARKPRVDRAAQEPLARRWQLVALAPGLSAAVGPFSKPRWGAGAGLGLHFSSWQLALRGSVFAGQTLTTSLDSLRFGAAVQQLSAGLSTCYHSTWKRLGLGPCVTLRLDRVVAHGVGDGVTPKKQFLHWPTASAGVSGRLRLLPYLAVSGSLDLDWNVVRPRLVIEGLGEVERVATAGATGTLWVEWIF